MMRLFLAGLILALTPSAGLGQVTGFVESLGFGGCYRPDAWTPMVVNLTSQLPTTETYQLQVVQEDLDKDTVSYTREITLNAGVQEKYWVYFLPQPTNGGLPASPADLQRVLKVYLCARPSTPGAVGKQLLRLPLALTSLNNLDPVYDPAFSHPKGRKLVLYVSEADSQPNWREYENAAGTLEDVVMVRVSIADLPENPLGYDSVDSILWLAAKADKLDEAGARRKEAIEQFVRAGGQLVVCAPAQPHDIDALADLLPIDPREVTMTERRSLEPLASLAAPRLNFKRHEKPAWGSWQALGLRAPFKFAKVAPGDKSVVEDWIEWGNGSGDRSPWLARRGIGLGSVTWVAQDLGDTALQGLRDPGNGKIVDPSIGWPYVWDHVFGWNNATRVGPNDDEKVKKTRELYDASVSNGSPVDLGQSLFRGAMFQGKGVGLMSVAIAFFIIYWIAAGPGSYMFLAGRQRTQFSWFAFGLAAIAAAFLTMLLVKLILRGGPEVKHTSVVQAVPGDHTRVRSRFGLYIPRDGEQTIELNDASADTASYLTPLIEHPQDVSDTEFPAAQDYTIPVRDAEQSIQIQIPFRSTLKKLEARWAGDVSGGITGSARLLPPLKGYISGSLINQVGHDLENVYFAFSHPQTGVPDDWVLYVPRWKNGQSLDLYTEFAAAAAILSQATHNGQSGNVKGTLAPLLWPRLWYARFGGDQSVPDASQETVHASFAIMSLVDRLPPPVTMPGDRSFAEHRFDLLRRGGRDLNRSGAIAAGELVILGEARDTPIPCPLTVDGQKMGGDGVSLFQAVLPLDRSEADQSAATTQPAGAERKIPA